MALDDTLSSREVRFIGALLAGEDVPRGAELAGVSERTGWRYLERPAVRRELARRQDAALSEAGARLSVAMSESVDVLREVMRDRAASAPARVSAARAVLDAGLKLSELVSLAERLTEVEARLAERGDMMASGRYGGVQSVRLGGVRADDF